MEHENQEGRSCDPEHADLSRGVEIKSSNDLPGVGNDENHARLLAVPWEVDGVGAASGKVIVSRD